MSRDAVAWLCLASVVSLHALPLNNRLLHKNQSKPSTGNHYLSVIVTIMLTLTITAFVISQCIRCRHAKKPAAKAETLAIEGTPSVPTEDLFDKQTRSRAKSASIVSESSAAGGSKLQSATMDSTETGTNAGTDAGTDVDPKLLQNVKEGTEGENALSKGNEPAEEAKEDKEEEEGGGGDGFWKFNWLKSSKKKKKAKAKGSGKGTGIGAGTKTGTGIGAGTKTGTGSGTKPVPPPPVLGPKVDLFDPAHADAGITTNDLFQTKNKDDISGMTLGQDVDATSATMGAAGGNADAASTSMEAMSGISNA